MALIIFQVTVSLMTLERTNDFIDSAMVPYNFESRKALGFTVYLIVVLIFHLVDGTATKYKQITLL